MTQGLKAIALASATGTCFFFFWLGSFVLSWIVLPLAHASMSRRRPVERIRRCQAIVGHGFRFFIASMRMLRLLDFRPGRVTLDLPDGPFVMIANHPTLIDVTALLAVYPTICCVAKSELFRSPLVGRLLRYSGHIEGGAVGSMEGASVVRQALNRLDRGQPVLIFPEGTRSPAFGLRRFKRGVFEIALRAGVPVVPILITCDPPTLLRGQSWYSLPKMTAAYDLIQLPTAHPDTFGSDSQTAATHFHGLFQTQIDAHQAGRGADGPAMADLPSTA